MAKSKGRSKRGKKSRAARKARKASQDRTIPHGEAEQPDEAPPSRPPEPEKERDFLRVARPSRPEPAAADSGREKPPHAAVRAVGSLSRWFAAAAQRTRPADRPAPPFTLFVAGTALLLALMTVVAYIPSLDNWYIWDDPEYVVNNPNLRTADGLARIWTEKEASPQFYPLVFTTFWIEHALYGLKPFGYHLVNILCHAGGVVLLWLILRRLHVPGALLAAAIFALHPVHVESVAWITERKNVLSGLFYLAAFLAYLRFALHRNAPNGPGEPLPAGDTEEQPPLGRPWGFYALAVVFFVCALLCKTVTASLPAAILLVLWWAKRGLRRWDVTPTLPFFVLGFFFGQVTAALERDHVGAFGSEWDLGMLEHVLLAGRIPWFYAGKLFWPNDLTFIYPRWTIDSGSIVQYLFPAALVVAVLALYFARKKIGRGPIAAVLFFTGTLFPVLGFFNVYPMRFSFVADHFQYLASLGLIVLVSTAAASVIGTLRRRRRGTGYIVCCAVLAVLGSLTWEQQKNYRDEETLWRATLAVNPDAWIAHNNLGEILCLKEIDKKPREAAEHCRAALALKPGLAEALGNLGNSLFYMKEYEEAVASYSDAIAALKKDEERYAGESSKSKARQDRLSALNNRGAALVALDRLDEAVTDFERVLAEAPDDRKALYQLGDVLQRQEKYAAAFERYDEALRVFPRPLEAFVRRAGIIPDPYELTRRRAECLFELGKSAEAEAGFRAALALVPSSGEATAGLARTLACRRGATQAEAAEAIRLAESVCRATAHRDPVMLDLLAAAFARAGQYGRAVETAEKARRFAKALEMRSLAEEIRQRCLLYRTERPCDG